MNEFLRKLLEDCEGVSNVKIVCKDGIMFSHKIIVASASNFIKNLILDIPFGDDISLFLPDFQKNTVEKFLNSTNKELPEEAEDIFVGTNPTAHVLQYIKKDEQENYVDYGNKITSLKMEEKCVTIYI